MNHQKSIKYYHDKIKGKVYDVRKLHFQAYHCEAFAEDKKQHYCGDLVLGWTALQKTVFNH